VEQANQENPQYDNDKEIYNRYLKNELLNFSAFAHFTANPYFEFPDRENATMFLLKWN
jgi:hypothetical protein